VSLELYAFLEVLPDRGNWQAAIEQTGVDLQLDPDLDLNRHKGFSPCKLEGTSSGFELYVSTASEVIRDYPSAGAAAGARGHAICCRWGGDLAEAACVLVANLALARNFGGIVYDPAEDVVCDADALEKQVRECLDMI
jgi:hypothetical protein